MGAAEIIVAMISHSRDRDDSGIAKIIVTTLSWNRSRAAAGMLSISLAIMYLNIPQGGNFLKLMWAPRLTHPYKWLPVSVMGSKGC